MKEKELMAQIQEKQKEKTEYAEKWQYFKEHLQASSLSDKEKQYLYNQTWNADIRDFSNLDAVSSSNELDFASDNLDGLAGQLCSMLKAQTKTATTMTGKEIENKQAQLYESYVDELDKQEQQAIEQIKASDSAIIKQAYEPLRHKIRMITRGHTKALVIVGEGGWRKSFEVRATLNSEGKELNKDYIIVRGCVSPLALYHIIYENRDRIVVFDDIAKLLENEYSIAILKALLEETVPGKRIVAWQSTSDKLHAPSKFQFNGYTILIMNQLPDQRNPDHKALLSRPQIYEVKLTHREKLAIIQQIAGEPYHDLTNTQRKEIADYITDNADTTTKNLSVRTLIHALEIREYTDNWKTLVKELMQTDEELYEAKKAIKENPKTTDQARAYTQATGKSTRTFYRLKQRLTDGF